MIPNVRIITPFHNVESFVLRCIESVQTQTIVDWKWYMLDDCSRDNSFRTVCDFVCNDQRIYVETQSVQKFQVINYVSMLKNPQFSSEDIIISIDADDWLPDCHVFERILEAYADDKTWITYGSYICSNKELQIYGALEGVPSKIRKLPWKTSHLRTWKLWLWRLIKEESFLGPNNQPLRCAGDLAWMFPMMEMAGSLHSKWLKEINYIYNRSNPMSCSNIRREEQLVNNAWLRNQSPYERIF